MGAAGGGEHGPVVLLETTTRKKKKKKRHKNHPLSPSVPARLFHPTVPPGTHARGQAVVSPALMESLQVAPCLPGATRAGSAQPPGTGFLLLVGCTAPVGPWWVRGRLTPQPGKRVGAVVLAAVSPGEAPSPELRLSFLPLEGKCVARGIGDLLPPL